MAMDEGEIVRRKMGDRRNRPRYDIVGDLWGTLETVLHLPLRNLSRGGALIHSHVPLPSQSVPGRPAGLLNTSGVPWGRAGHQMWA